jgi:predicted Zn-dependent protease
LTDEPVTNDKLGNQMKSFTAWLKSMKKLHPSKLEEQNLATEQVIQNSAEESNINTEVLTEAMAEVLIKQNKRDKAIEMFTKLSLINPSKSAYFAAKIESIKSS